MKHHAASLGTLAAAAACAVPLSSPVVSAMASMYYSAPLCNTAAISTCDVATATPFSSLVASAAASGSLAIVPCNTCAVVDYTSYETVNLPQGLDVVGRLMFPPSANVVLNATSIFVQGVWDMEAPDADNRVTVNLYGDDEEVYFYPHDMCGGGYDPGCADRKNVGFKPFVVAGGQLNINAIDAACPSWTKLKEKVSDTELKVDQAFASCLKEGDELLITSDTTQWSHDQKTYITSVDPINGVIGLESPISKVLPGTEKTAIAACQNGIASSADTHCCSASCGSCGGSGCSSRPGGAYKCCTGKITRVCDDIFDTVCQHGDTPDLEYSTPDYAVEVASLSRAVSFTSTVTNDIGGHFIIFHTSLQQIIIGIEVNKFGQSGVLGRYPIHFHMSGPSTGSVVSKNVITNSNQRCILIHDTDEVLVEDNVAHNMLGHCIATETGSERNNKFLNNLVSRTRKLYKSNGQSDSPGFMEKHIAASFWVRSAMNEWAGNVAAGSESQGYWLEMSDKKSNQLFEMAFRDNVAHSNKEQALTTYRPGWTPEEGGIIHGFKAYKNNFDGLKFHATERVTIRNGLFADNLYSVRYGAFNGLVTLQNTTIDALSQDYQYRLNGGSSSPFTSRGIYSSSNSVVHNDEMVPDSLALHGVTFQNFKGSSRTMEFYFHDLNYNQRGFGDPINATDISVINSLSKAWPYFNCGGNYYHSYLEDIHGNLIAPDEAYHGQPGFIVAGRPGMTAFLPEGACEPISYSGSNSYQPDGCSYYCTGVCVRSVEIEPKGNGQSYDKMMLTNENGQSWTMDFNGRNRVTERIFFLVLPAGTYTGQFYDSNDVQVFPEWVNVKAHTKPKCTNYVTKDMFTFNATGTATDYCHKAVSAGDVCCSDQCGGGCGGSSCCNIGPAGCSGCCAGSIIGSGRICEHFYDTACVIPREESS